MGALRRCEILDVPIGTLRSARGENLKLKRWQTGAAFRPDAPSIRDPLVKRMLCLPAAGVVTMILTTLLLACGDGSPETQPVSPSASSSEQEQKPSPTPTTSESVTPTTTPPLDVEQLAFVGPEGGVWLVNHDGTEGRLLAADVCGDQGEWQALDLQWAPTGDRLSCLWMTEGRDDPGQPESTLRVLDASGSVLVTQRDVYWYYWSPDGSAIAYQTGIGEVFILEIESGEVKTIPDIDWVLAWPAVGRLIVGIDKPQGSYPLYEANWLDLASGDTEPIPRLDCCVHFLVFPDGQRAVLLRSLPGPIGLVSVYEFGTGVETEIENSSAGYDSEIIPPRQISISRDGSAVFWADAGGGGPATIWTADSNGTGLRQLGTVPSTLVAVSPRGHVAYVERPTGLQHLACSSLTSIPRLKNTSVRRPSFSCHGKLSPGGRNSVGLPPPTTSAALRSARR